MRQILLSKKLIFNHKYTIFTFVNKAFLPQYEEDFKEFKMGYPHLG